MKIWIGGLLVDYIDTLHGYDMKIKIRDAYIDWLIALDDWSTYLTWTMRDIREEDVSRALLNRWIRELNKHEFGSKYVKKVGHSYFSYVIGMEAQLRGAIHFHGLIAGRIDFSLAHKVWNELAGFMWIEKIKSTRDTTRYITKYVLKGCDLDVFKRNQVYIQ
jgi:hypothetical protein